MINEFKVKLPKKWYIEKIFKSSVNNKKDQKADIFSFSGHHIVEDFYWLLPDVGPGEGYGPQIHEDGGVIFLQKHVMWFDVPVRVGRFMVVHYSQPCTNSGEDLEHSSLVEGAAGSTAPVELVLERALGVVGQHQHGLASFVVHYVRLPFQTWSCCFN